MEYNHLRLPRMPEGNGALGDFVFSKAPRMVQKLFHGEEPNKLGLTQIHSIYLRAEERFWSVLITTDPNCGRFYEVTYDIQGRQTIVKVFGQVEEYTIADPITAEPFWQ